MIQHVAQRFLKGWAVRVNAAMRCLRKKHYVLVCWDRCDDGDIDFKISHKGADAGECAHRCRVDAAEILQEMYDGDTAIFEANDLLKSR